MTHDTTKDPRIIVAHLAANLLKKSVKQKPEGLPLRVPRDRLTDLAAAFESAVMTLMYSYQEPQALSTSQPVTQLIDAAKTLSDAYEGVITNKDDRTLLRANIRWCLRVFTGLKDRFGNPGKTIASGVDLLAVGIRSVAKSGNFLTTRVSDGDGDYAVMTNLTGLTTNSVLAAAFLPPREIGGIISEAMFLGSEKRPETAGTVLTEKQVDAKDAASILFEAISHPPR